MEYICRKIGIEDRGVSMGDAVAKQVEDSASALVQQTHIRLMRTNHN